MTVLFILIAVSLVGVLLGRRLLGLWMNHLSIYSITWGLSLSAFELHLIAYNPISTVAWLYIAVSWVSVFLGAALVLFSVRDQRNRHAEPLEFNPSYLKVPIVVMSLVAAVSLIQEIRQTQAEYGGLLNAVLLNPNELYSRHVEGDLSGMPHLSLFGFPASCLAGAYTARIRKLTLTAIFPLFLAVAGAMVAMQRAGIMFNVVLFIYAYFFFPRSQRLLVNRRSRMMLVLASVVVFSFLLIGGHRGSYVYHVGQTQTLNDIGEYSSIVPSLYFYVSASGPAFSQYLLHPEVDYNSFFGCNTFAPVWRLLAKLGFRTYVPYYTPFYYVPQDTNQATYLAYIDADFGPAGIVLVPCIMSAILTVLARRVAQEFRLWHLMLYVNLLLVTTFSFSGYYVAFTYWLVSIVVSALIGWWIDSAIDGREQHQVSATI